MLIIEVVIGQVEPVAGSQFGLGKTVIEGISVRALAVASSASGVEKAGHDRSLELTPFDEASMSFPATYWASSTSIENFRTSPASNPRKSNVICVPPSATCGPTKYSNPSWPTIDSPTAPNAPARRRSVQKKRHLRRGRRLALVAVDDEMVECRSGRPSLERDLNHVAGRVVTGCLLRSKHCRSSRSAADGGSCRGSIGSMWQ